MKTIKITIVLSFFVFLCSNYAKATVILYDQNFENPQAFVNDDDDVNIFNSVNDLYGNQPSGFSFSQAFTVETLLITGNEAFGTGYSDPSGIGGNYSLGMLGDSQNDLLGLSFDVGEFDFLNFRLDISSIDLSTFGGPFIPASGEIPEFQFTLFDNPSGFPGLGSGVILDQLQGSGVISAPAVFDWTELLLPLDASGSTNGNVILRIDLLSGEYAAMDNFRIASSDIPGDVGTPIPEPSTMILMAFGLLGLLGIRHVRKN